MKKIFLYTFFLSIVLSKGPFALNQNNYWNKNKNITNYDSLYSESVSLIEKNEVTQSIKILIELSGEISRSIKNKSSLVFKQFSNSFSIIFLNIFL